ncbi:MAG: site-specific DNA-methyltransferase [Candidatus Delongbacteria bacterium]|nr:site-specific DNA-methyltransferase [Candidatus Delongbacteria bacterium]
MKLSQHEITDLIERLQKGENFPDDYKYKLFPVTQKEYELVYGGKMRREDILANEDGVFPVPLQIEKIYNSKREQWKDGWKNIIAFGDNLQFLKTIYENKDLTIKESIKGNVKLVYIDPPFGTGDEYEGNKGQKGYSAKSKGAEFVEFIRRRLILIREILDKDGIIVVRQGYNFGHYIKVTLDEVFGKASLINEIVVNRGAQKLGGTKKYSTAYDTLFVYSKGDKYFFEPFRRERKSKEPKTTNMYMKGERFPRERTFRDQNGEKVILLPPPGQHWKFIQDKINEMYDNEIIYLHFPEEGKDTGIRKLVNGKLEKVTFVPRFHFDKDKTIDSNWTDIQGYTKTKIYPTENSEDLLYRVIKSFSKEGDIVMDCFVGSGCTAAVAEKLNRKWITCDIGKLSFYTIQKRLLNIETSKSIEYPKKQYGKPAKSFITVNTGHYDLAKIFDLKQKEYSNFVMNLFEVAPKKKTISGIQIDGEKKDGFNVIVWQYWKFKNSSVDEDFLRNLHSHIGTKAGKRIYIISPASYVDFISDYYEIDNIRYYFLKVPYQIIRELHKVQFKKFRQPQSKSDVNDLEDAIGFHFIRQPEVKSEIKEKSKEYHLTISKFLSDFSEEETDKDMDNFESLAMILIDKDFDGETFDMDMYYFAEDLLHKKKKKTDEEESVENIKEELKHLNQISLPPIPKKECGKRLMLIYVDIYGNEFKEEFKLK